MGGVKKWTKKEWEKHVLVNCHDPYSLAVIFEALCIAHYGEKKKGSYVNGLSGAQHDYAVKLAEKIKLK